MQCRCRLRWSAPREERSEGTRKKLEPFDLGFYQVKAFKIKGTAVPCQGGLFSHSRRQSLPTPHDNFIYFNFNLEVPGTALPACVIAKSDRSCFFPLPGSSAPLRLNSEMLRFVGVVSDPKFGINDRTLLAFSHLLFRNSLSICLKTRHPLIPRMVKRAAW